MDRTVRKYTSWNVVEKVREKNKFLAELRGEGAFLVSGAPIKGSSGPALLKSAPLRLAIQESTDKARVNLALHRRLQVNARG